MNIGVHAEWKVRSRFYGIGHSEFRRSKENFLTLNKSEFGPLADIRVAAEWKARSEFAGIGHSEFIGSPRNNFQQYFRLVYLTPNKSEFESDGFAS